MSVPLVLLHGSFGQGADWSGVVAALGRPAQTPDLPAHGARFAERALSFDATVADLVAELPESCDLVGYSLGGRLALAAALRAPRGRVRSLVLESAHPGLTDEAGRAERLAADRARGEQLLHDPQGFLEEFYAAPLFDSFRQQAQFAVVTGERIARAGRSPADLAATIVALSPGNQPELAGELMSSGIPTLVVTGQLDVKYAAVGRNLRAAAPADAPLQVVEVDGAGHNVHFEQPARYAEVLRVFWEGLE